VVDAKALRRVSDGYLYELQMSQQARFRAHGLDAAHRIQRRVSEAVAAALAEDREVVEVEEDAYFEAASYRCDGTSRCRAALHDRDCESRTA
jgi:hypothetical protein